jgi:hypothetical protein
MSATTSYLSPASPQSAERLLNFIAYPGGDFSLSPVRRKLVPDDSAAVGCSLGLSNPTNSRIPLDLPQPLPKKPSLPRGSHGLTSFGRKMVRSAGAFIEQKYSKNRCSFVTLTLPYTDQVYLDFFAVNAGRIMNRVMEAISRELSRDGLPSWWLWVAEFQTRGALHYHLLFPGRNEYQTWALTPSQIDEIWYRTLENHGLPAVSTRSACQIVQVKKSVVAYLCKYMTKGGQNFQDYQNSLSCGDSVSDSLPEPAFPSSWWGCSGSLRKIIKKNIIRIIGVTQQFFTWSGALETLRSLSGTVYATIREHENRAVGLYGRVKVCALSDLVHSYLSI